MLLRLLGKISAFVCSMFNSWQAQPLSLFLASTGCWIVACRLNCTWLSRILLVNWWCSIFAHPCSLPSGNQTWQWKIPKLNGGLYRNITESMVHFLENHVWLPESIHNWETWRFVWEPPIWIPSSNLNHQFGFHCHYPPVNAPFCLGTAALKDVTVPDGGGQIGGQELDQNLLEVNWNKFGIYLEVILISQYILVPIYSEYLGYQYVPHTAVAEV